MRLEKASYKAIRYSCLNFHYAKVVPCSYFGFSVFNDQDEFCGVIVYNLSATPNLARMLGLIPGQVLELSRMALNGKQGMTSKALSISISLVKKLQPFAKCLISYADTNQNHLGIIYQATNWIYSGETKDNRHIKVDGVTYHRRSAYCKFGNTYKLETLIARGHEAEYVEVKRKHRYLYPLDKSVIETCRSLSKPYPKKCDNSITANASGFQPGEEGQHHLIAQNCDVTVTNG